MQLEINEAEDDIVHDHVINDEEDLYDDTKNYYWIEGVHDDAYLFEQDCDGTNDVPMRYDRNHDFSQLN